MHIVSGSGDSKDKDSKDKESRDNSSNISSEHKRKTSPRLKQVIINLSPIRRHQSLREEDDLVLKETYDRISYSKLNLSGKKRNLELRKILIKVLNVAMFITTIIIQTIQAVMYSSFVSPQSLSAAKWFNISSICLATIGAGFELFTYLEDYDGTVSLYIRTINQYDKLLNKIEKISHTDVKDRDPSKTERIKNSYVDLQTILDLN